MGGSTAMAGPGTQRDALLNAARRFANELLAAREPQRRMPRSDWSRAEAAIHVLQLLRVFAHLAQGGSSPYTRHVEFPRVSNELIATEPERDPATLAGLLEGATAKWLAEASQRPPTDHFDWHGIVTITFADATGILLGEFLLHGRDIARAEN
ncbi:MAG: maleylpyruvate isomerase N-terminal domain-containing protein, partial [Actinobacteria bacterium]|nr:maleylpyruvate isomerase N-terminal domain-containing protein [Actinomycetota bacterium]